MQDIYKEAVKIIAEGGEAAIVTIVSASRSTPRGAGTKMLVRADGTIRGTIGGGAVEAAAVKLAAAAMKTGRPELRHFDLVPDKEPGMVCGGEMDIFVEPVIQTPTLFLFGGGHISLALARIAKMLGFRVAVIDDRAEFANRDRFPDADLVIAQDFDKAFSGLRIDRLSYLVIVTRSHKDDQRVLEQALKTQARYVGMIGSKTKVKAVFGNLLERGADSKTLDMVHSPIGLEIHAETPEEIAISIMAEIVKVRREAPRQSLRIDSVITRGPFVGNRPECRCQGLRRGNQPAPQEHLPDASRVSVWRHRRRSNSAVPLCISAR
jgi:xanthine dehydrogenase accessory factor